MCERLTRRQLLRYAALVAATFPASKLLRDGWSLAAEAQTGLAVPIHLELVTVTDTSAILTWFTGDPTQPDEFGRPAPVAAPGRVLLGTSPDPSSWEEVARHDPTPYHYVEITGLTPGTTYYFRAESNGVPATPTAFSPLHPDPSNGGVFTTLVPPPGREVARVAWLNDLHIGERVSGLAYSDPRLPRGGFPPGFPADPDHPYWRTMAVAAVTEALARGCVLLLANGDLTDEARPAEVAEARQHLERFGVVGGGEALGDGVRWVRPDGPRAVYVTRGNHDRAHSGEEWASCPAAEGRPDLNDCFLDTFRDAFTDGRGRFAVVVGDDRARYRFVGLDSNDIATGAGQLDTEELEFLEAQLAAGDATIPLFHHPVSDLATTLAVPPVTFGVRPQDQGPFRQLIAAHDNVVGVYNGHTHRNLRATATDTGPIPYFEGGAVKEYPGGYTVVRLFEGGYMVNFYKSADPEARAWSERSRGEYLGLYPYYTLGGLGDRNWVYLTDAATRRGAQPAPSPPAGGGEGAAGGAPPLPATGAGAAAGAGLALAAAARAVRRAVHGLHGAGLPRPRSGAVALPCGRHGPPDGSEDPSADRGGAG